MAQRFLNAGALDQRITVQRRAAGKDNLGQPNGAWATLFDAYAAAEPLRGREFFNAGQMQSEVVVRFRIRWRDTVQPTDRVLWRNQAHDIVSIIEVGGAKVELELMCSSGVRDGR